MPNRSTYTEHGEVAYETVTCMSCENEVPKETAMRVVMGDVEKYRDRHYRGQEEYSFDTHTIRKGWACEYCRDNPVQFPSRSVSTFFRRFIRSQPFHRLVFGALIASWAVAIVLLVIL